MPKLPCVSGQKVARALERLGFERRRQKSSHLVMRRGSVPGARPGDVFACEDEGNDHFLFLYRSAGGSHGLDN